MHLVQGCPAFDLQVSFIVHSHSSWRLILESIVIIALHQYHHVLDYSRPGGAELPSPKVQAAAEDSSRLAAELVELDLVKFCPTIWLVPFSRLAHHA